ncbi:GntR family transcriptional regulator [Thalassotalea euphylliae]|uniref:GntR family transcriptional regulator n=1 Tax=Thalassotalea euphylliae TaxID=1655234 RepID=A0A3E0TMN9_9GAMM|nr:GntR family transcriptional regulator [Thalassotalea euphylliae]REL25841.1 GntR family transcriptional regulator [Thalassotalea euphylliae]
MEIEIDLDDPTPVFTQLIAQIKSAVATDMLAPGAPLPSIRQLANELEINSKTVAKAYKLLERDKIVQSKGYRGSFIHTDAKQYCHRDLKQWATDKLTHCIDELKAQGVTDSEIRVAFGNLMNNKR